MLARVQKFTTLGGLALALLWAALCWRSGHAAWALGGAALMVGSYALVLAMEFLFIGLAHGDEDPTPRATAAQRAAAWWMEVCAAPRVFCWRQPFFSSRFPDSLPSDAHGRRGVLFVHGFFCNRGLWNPWLKRLDRGGTPFVALNLEPVFGSIDDYVPLIESAVSRLESATGDKPLLVAHSMGGLAVRAWMRDGRSDTRVRGVITLGTPHRGTWMARAAFSPNARQMRLGSDWLRVLAASEPASRRRLFLCFFSRCDNIVFPADHACLPGSETCHLPATAHVHMLHHPTVLRRMLHSLQASR